MFWVLVPSILMEDAGEQDFGLNWGLTLFANVMGMLVFGEAFDLIYEWQGDGPKCSGLNCVLIQFIAFGVFLLLAAGLCYFALTKDIQDLKNRGGKPKKDTKPRKSDKKPDKKPDRSGRSKSKDSKSSLKSRSGSKSKSKSKR